MADQLSGGMKQKLGLATALVHRPKVLLLDEPTGGVDPVTRQDFWQLIIRLVSQEGVSVLVSTPYMDEASRCTHVGFINRGQMIIEGTPGQVASRLNGRILELVGEPLEELRHLAQRHAGCGRRAVVWRSLASARERGQRRSGDGAVAAAAAGQRRERAAHPIDRADVRRCVYRIGRGSRSSSKGEMDMEIKDKVVVVTGASAGIGLATARAAALAGAKVVVAARSIDLLTQLSEELQRAGREVWSSRPICASPPRWCS